MATTPDSTTKTIDVEGVGLVELTVEERGEGRAFLVLHGGAGPQSVTAFAQLLADDGGHRVLVPRHPGFGGTTRPETLDSVAKLATLYLGLLDELNLEDVTVIGNSVGGWISAEMATLGSPRISRLVLLDAPLLQVVGNGLEAFGSRPPQGEARNPQDFRRSFLHSRRSQARRESHSIHVRAHDLRQFDQWRCGPFGQSHESERPVPDRARSAFRRHS